MFLKQLGIFTTFVILNFILFAVIVLVSKFLSATVTFILGIEFFLLLGYLFFRFYSKNSASSLLSAVHEYDNSNKR